MKNNLWFILWKAGDVTRATFDPKMSHVKDAAVYKILKNHNPYVFVAGTWVLKNTQPKVQVIHKCDKIAYIRMRLRINKDWAIKAMLALFDRQTSSEQTRRVTIEKNAIGFDSVDAPIMTMFCMQLNRKVPLNDEQLAVLHKRIHRYAEQVYSFSNQEKLEASIKNYYANGTVGKGILETKPAEGK